MRPSARLVYKLTAVRVERLPAGSRSDAARFYRRIAIPEHVKAENAVAAFKNGVLEIEMPAIPVPEVKKRTVDIKG